MKQPLNTPLKPKYKPLSNKDKLFLKKCLLCSETRGLQKCHIISRKADKLLKKFGNAEENCLRLCPNHHWYLDHNLLTKEEFTILLPHLRSAVLQFLQVSENLQRKFLFANDDLQKKSFEILIQYFDQIEQRQKKLIDKVNNENY